MFIGLLLIVLGALALIYQGVTYTSQEKIFNLGSSIRASADFKKTIPLSAFLGGLALAGGILLVVMGRNKALYTSVIYRQHSQ